MSEEMKCECGFNKCFDDPDNFDPDFCCGGCGECLLKYSEYYQNEGYCPDCL